MALPLRVADGVWALGSPWRARSSIFARRSRGGKSKGFFGCGSRRNGHLRTGMTPPLCPLCGLPYERVTARQESVDPVERIVTFSPFKYYHVGGRECEDWEPKE